MDNIRYQKICDIDADKYICAECPAFIKSAAILFDRDTKRSLLQIVISGKGGKAVSSVTVKLVCYDKYGNTVPDNGRKYTLRSFSDLGITASEDGRRHEKSRLIRLSSEDIIDCDIFIVSAADETGKATSFGEDDYIPKKQDGKRRSSGSSVKSEVSEPRAEKSGKKAKIALSAAIVSVVVIYLSVSIGVFFFKNVVEPGRIEKKVSDYIESHDYTLAIDYAISNGKTELAESTALKAADYYFSVKDYDRAIGYIKRQSDSDKTATMYIKSAQALSDAENYTEAVSIAKKSGITSLLADTLDRAISFYSEKQDYQSADKYISQRGNRSEYSDIYIKAADKYIAEGDSKTAVFYAVKSQSPEKYSDIYSGVIKEYAEAGDYNTAALLIAESGNMKTDIVTDELIDTIYKKADTLFIRKNLSEFEESLPLSQKIRINSSIIDADTKVVAVTEAGRVVGSEPYTWADMRSVRIGANHTVGIKADGTPVATGDNTYMQCGIAAWSDITDIAAGEYHTVGVKADGTVVAVGLNSDGQCDVFGITGAVSVSAGKSHTVILKKDGTVIAVGNNDYGQCNVKDMTGIIAISAGEYHTVALREDGTVVAVGRNENGECNVSDWIGITAISAGYTHTVGTKLDKSAVTTSTACGDLSAWSGIEEISAGSQNTVCVKEDGTALVAGEGITDVSNLRDIAVKRFR